MLTRQGVGTGAPAEWVMLREHNRGNSPTTRGSRLSTREQLVLLHLSLLSTYFFSSRNCDIERGLRRCQIKSRGNTRGEEEAKESELSKRALRNDQGTGAENKQVACRGAQGGGPRIVQSARHAIEPEPLFLTAENKRGDVCHSRALPAAFV